MNPHLRRNDRFLGKGAETYSLAQISLLPVFYPAVADNPDRTTN
jgi:hypothetical protein